MPAAMSACSAETSFSRRLSSTSARSLVRGGADAEAHLAQPRAFAHDDREGLRANLGVERPAIAGRDLVEGGNAVGDHAGEDVEPAGGALGIGGGRQRGSAAPCSPAAARYRRSPFRAPRLCPGRWYAAAGRASLSATCVGAGQEACAHAIGLRAKAQVEAGGLQLVGRNGSARRTWPASMSPRIACTGRMPAPLAGACRGRVFACALTIDTLAAASV